MPSPTIAYFVTPHGFGHASRSAAVMEALGRSQRHVAFEIVTTVPEWFFSQSLSVRHRVLPVVSDVGLVQIDPVREDVQATVTALGAFWSTLEKAADELIRNWGGEAPRYVVSDISPLGLEVARRLGVPSILVENFTWDWIYAAYLKATPDLLEFIDRSAELTATATLHIQCEPACRRLEDTTLAGPVSRRPRNGGIETRRALGLDDADSRPLVLLTMGGMGWGPLTPDSGSDYFSVALGGVRSPIYPPDLVWAADVVIAKLGYSTVAECFRAGSRLGYITRADFPESPVLEGFVRRHLPSLEVSPDSAEEGDWHRQIERLLALPAGIEQQHNGADEIADLLLAHLP